MSPRWKWFIRGEWSYGIVQCQDTRKRGDTNFLGGCVYSAFNKSPAADAACFLDDLCYETSTLSATNLGEIDNALFHPMKQIPKASWEAYITRKDSQSILGTK